MTQPKAMAPALSVGVKWVQMPCCDEQVVETRLTQPSQPGSLCAAALEIGRELSKLAGGISTGRGAAPDWPGTEVCLGMGLSVMLGRWPAPASR